MWTTPFKSSCFSYGFRRSTEGQGIQPIASRPLLPVMAMAGPAGPAPRVMVSILRHHLRGERLFLLIVFLYGQKKLVPGS
jgi:hypothetical protein